MLTIEKEIQQQLWQAQDKEYKKFHCKLMPTVDPDTVIGVRTPVLRQIGKELAKNPASNEFLKCLPHTYYEENNLHGYLLEKLKDYDEVIAGLNAFLPYVNNWATCDMMSPKIFKKHLPELYTQIHLWLAADDVYTVRFGIGMLMAFFLDDAFEEEMLGLVAAIESDEYYINMMSAWYIATALAKQPQAAKALIESKTLPLWVHNKAIQKAVESRRISDEDKAYLKTLKIKNKQSHRIKKG